MCYVDGHKLQCSWSGLFPLQYGYQTVSVTNTKRISARSGHPPSWASYLERTWQHRECSELKAHEACSVRYDRRGMRLICYSSLCGLEGSHRGGSLIGLDPLLYPSTWPASFLIWVFLSVHPFPSEWGNVTRHGLAFTPAAAIRLLVSCCYARCHHPELWPLCHLRCRGG